MHSGGGSTVTPLDRRPEYDLLAATLVGEVLAWTGPDRRLSPPVRRELLRVLPALLVDPASRQAFLDSLADWRRDAGAKRQLSRGTAGVDIPLATLAGAGPDALSDEQLAALSTDPLQLEATADALDGCATAGELGQIWWDAMSRAGQAAYPDRGVDVPPPRPSPARRLRAFAPWAVSAAAVVVSGLVWWAGGLRGGPAGELAATTTLTRQGVLGAGDRYSLSVQSPEEGFVTVVIVPADGRPVSVLPGYGRDDLVVRPGTPVAVGNLPVQIGDAVLTFVTPTPATDTVRKSVDRLLADPNRNPAADVVVRAVTAALLDARHPWVGVAPVRTVP
jgi:hypothetical protein